MMKSVLLLTVFFAVALSIKININPKVHQVIQHDSWVEEKSDLLKDVHYGSLLGFRRTESRDNLEYVNYDVQPGSLPTNFDSRTNWPNCSTISTIYNQARCGSCWAFGAIESVSARFCTMKNTSVLLSFEDIVTCDSNDGGCDGGDALSAFQYIKDTGVVTNDCSPYTIPTCPPASQPCLNFVNTPSCVKKCEANYTVGYTQDKHHVEKVYGLDSVESMQQDLVNYGPFEACFNVYEDFLGYKSGVYVHKTGKFLGGHCVSIIGYGVESNLPYWLVKNSWTTYWGDQGTFKILSGKNECGIESDVVSGFPQ